MNHKGRFANKIDVGKVRLTSDDSALSTINSNGDILLCVCDGMGGYKSGDFASKIVIDELKDAFINCGKFYTKFQAIRFFSKHLKQINKKIFRYAQEKDFKDMGTTIALAAIINNFILVVNAGDSRCYFYDKDSLELKTEDQTYVNYLYKTGKIKKEEMETHPKRHVLTNAVGIFPFLNIDYETYKYKGQNILLCSDGLYNNLSELDIKSVLSTNDLINTKIDTLIKCANDNGGSDNIAIVLWESDRD